MSIATTKQQKVGAEIKIRNLCKTYGDVHAANNVNLDIEGGKFVTLLGPSGSGKTTILMCIAGFIEPTAGDILVANSSIINKPPHLRNIGMVFQNYALFPHMSVFDNIAFSLKMRKYNKTDILKKVEEVLEIVKLSGYENRRIDQLSGGQQQRVALARAVVFSPPLLLMDEPLGALDRKLREHMQLELVKIQKALNITVIYVTHDQEEALVMSDSIAILNEGVLLQEGSPFDVYCQPVDHFIADFLGESNFLDGKIDSIKGDRIVVTLDSEHKIFATKRSEELQPGGSVRCVIRPESLDIKRNVETNKNYLPGKIKEVMYVGDSTKYIVQVNNIEIVAKVLNRPGQERFIAGDNIDLLYETDVMLALKY